jgi:predicted aspartyl protease
MRLCQITFLSFVLLSAWPAFAADADECDPHSWFQQNALQGRTYLPLLCRGILDASFDRRKSALHKLRRVIDSNPHGAEAYQAHETLLSFFFRVGQYREALEQADAMLKLKPTAADVLEERPLIFGLAKNSDQSGKGKHSILTKSNIEDGNPHIPVLVNKKSALWFMDTGANISVISDAEAAALGLVVHTVDTKMADISGTMMEVKITQVDELTIGRTHLKHVSFVVIPHTQPPFDDIPTEQQALLGIQVLWALRSIHIDKAQLVEIAGAADSDAPSSPMAFYQSQPVTQMSFEGKGLTFTLDTGATRTTLNPPFAEAFPETIALGEKTEHTLTGVGGSTTQHSVAIEKLRFTLAGKTTVLSPATVLLQRTTDRSEWAAGNLGYDLIRQTAPFSIDFRLMRLYAR